MKSEMVRRALKAGLLLSPTDLETMDERKLEKMIEKSGPGTSTATTGRPDPSNIVIKINRLKPAERITAENFVEYYNNKYMGLRRMLLKKLDAVSISNIKDEYNEVSVIGMVKSVTGSGFVVEDPTGEIGVISDNPPEPDDVVGIRGVFREGSIISKEIVLPDVPLDNEPARMNGISLILSDSLTNGIVSALKESDLALIRRAGEGTVNSKEESKIITDFTNPMRVSISRPGKKVNILVYDPGKGAGRDRIMDLLKKRHLSPKINIITSPDDQFIIDPVPDIFWVISDQKFIENYKGVTIISFGENGAAKIGLGKREVSFIDV